MENLAKLGKAIEEGNFDEAEKQTKLILDGGQPPGTIINLITKTLDEVGKRFSTGELYIPEMLVSAKSSQRAVNILKPHLAQAGVKPIGRIVIGSVKGDIHDLGKNIVTLMLRGAGFEVQDLGIDISPESFIEAVKSFNPQVLALSCLISTTMQSIPLTIDAIREAGIREQVKIVIGGPPTSDKFAKEVGADFCGRDAQIGVEISKSIVQA